jgi:hypothetical protein
MTRGELSDTARSGLSGHIGAVNWVTPFRQPLMAYNRWIEKNANQAVNDLLVDPAKIEQLIALARTPRRDFTRIEEILTRLAQQLPNQALYDDKEEK